MGTYQRDHMAERRAKRQAQEAQIGAINYADRTRVPLEERVAELEKHTHPPIAMDECPACFCLVMPENYDEHWRRMHGGQPHTATTIRAIEENDNAK